VYFSVGIIVFMSTLTLLALLYRFLYIPYLSDRVN